MLVEVLFMSKSMMWLKLVSLVFWVVFIMLFVGFERMLFFFWKVRVSYSLLLFCMNSIEVLLVFVVSVSM